MWSCVLLPSPPAPQQLTKLLALNFSIAGLHFLQFPPGTGVPDDASEH